jgi:hypothetical protein
MFYKKSLYFLAPLCLFISSNHQAFGMQEELQLSKEECEKICQDCNEESSETCANFCHKYYESSAIVRECIDFHRMIKESEKSFKEEQKRVEERLRAEAKRRAEEERRRVEAEKKRQIDEEARRRQALEEQRRREHEMAEQRRAEEERRRVEAEKKRQIDEEARRRQAIEEQRRRDHEMAEQRRLEEQRRAEEERRRVEAEKRVPEEGVPEKKPPRPLPVPPKPKPVAPKPPSPVVTHHELQESPAEIELKPGLGEREKALIAKRRGYLDESSEEEDVEDLTTSHRAIPTISPTEFWENKIRTLESQLEQAKKAHEAETKLLKKSQLYDRVRTLTRDLAEAKRQLVIEQKHQTGEQEVPAPIDWEAVQKALGQQEKSKNDS